MTLIIAPAEGYDSFVSVADADAYVDRMGLTGWPAEETEKEKLLRRATQYLTVRYDPKAQYLDPVHANIKAATVEAAIRAGELWADVDSQAVVEETIGPMTTKYAEPANGGQKSFPVIEGLMRGLGGRSTSSVQMLKRI